VTIKTARAALSHSVFTGISRNHLDRQRLRVAVHADLDEVVVDVADDGNGVAFRNPHAAFRLGRTTRGGGRGRGLYDAEQLARRTDVQLVLHGSGRGARSGRRTVPTGLAQRAGPAVGRRTSTCRSRPGSVKRRPHPVDADLR
jgi:hypothetical protein